MRSRVLLLVLLIVGNALALHVVGNALPATTEPGVYEFTEADKAFLSRFALSIIPGLPPAPSNAYADNIDAAGLGKTLFFDKRLSANGEVACATCHQPERYFTDGLPRSKGIGTTRRSAPSVLVAAYGPWQFWDGRKDSLWSQALGPIEDPAEQGLSRLEVAQKIAMYHRDAYEAVFGGKTDWKALSRYKAPASPLGDEIAQKHWASMPEQGRAAVNRIFSNVGKAIMAYERRLTLLPSRFDKFLAALASPGVTAERLKALLGEDEVRGMRLFMGKANCASCHNGPLFTNYEFHNVGAPEPDESAVDLGRYGAIKLLLADEFTCMSVWSDAGSSDCDEMRFLKRTGPELVGAFKTPSLRNIAETAPYMQSGQLATLRDVVEHYNKPKVPFFDPAQHPNRPHFDILPLALSDEEKDQLISFLKTLTSPRPDSDPWWSSHPATPQR
ncbi:MAG: cytochrome C peroxidase [Proteobacteria bacterium]|nr:cytochrome C peroxidase [Pseudomonadota bacterium]